MMHLDLGTGEESPCTKYYLEELEDRTAGSKDFDVDSFENSCRIDRLDIGGDNFVKTDVRDLPHKDETFDLVTAGKLLHYFDEQGMEEVLNEAERVLKPEGYIVGDVPINRLAYWPVYKFSEKKSIERYEEQLDQKFDLKDYGVGWNTQEERIYTKSVYFAGKK